MYILPVCTSILSLREMVGDLWLAGFGIGKGNSVPTRVAKVGREGGMQISLFLLC